ncbi:MULTISPECIES: hypothetical protein [Vibrio]|uniref:hypothetical protein n=1 Tax=Vibrio TaxID=662 RepID=UPI000BA96D79|nr:MULTISPECIES: hypothetical protein [Vibrio]PAR52825.1 hypothetical protein CGT93_15275 [Vibrio metoecus]PAR89519.1 hypothetical protein CGT83_10400 [Vibrio cholerae]
MSETAKTRSRKSATKPAVEGSDQQTVAASDSQSQAKAEQDEKLNKEAEAQAKLKAEAEESAKVQEDVATDVEAEHKAEADAEDSESNQEDEDDEEAKDESPMGAAVQLSVHAGRDLDIRGAFKVRAKSDQGFWRASIQFLRTKETVLLVVDQVPEDQPKTVAQEDGEPELVLFVTPQAAKRIHGEPNLVVEVVEVSDVIDVSDTE